MPRLKRPRSGFTSLKRASTPKRSRGTPNRTAHTRQGRRAGSRRSRRRLHRAPVKKRFGRYRKPRKLMSIAGIGNALTKIDKRAERGSNKLSYPGGTMGSLRAKMPGVSNQTLVPSLLAGTCCEWHLDMLLRQYKDGNKDCLDAGYQYPPDNTIHGDTAEITNWGITVTLTNLLGRATSEGNAAAVGKYWGDKYATDALNGCDLLDNKGAFILREMDPSSTRDVTLTQDTRVKYRVIIYRTAALPRARELPLYRGPCSIWRARLPNTPGYQFTDLFRMDFKEYTTWLDPTHAPHAYSVALSGATQVFDGIEVEAGEAESKAPNVTASSDRKIEPHTAEVYVERKPFGFNSLLQNIFNGTRLFSATTTASGSTTPADPRRSKLNRDYVTHVLHDKVYDVTGAKAGHDIESNVSTTAGGVTAGQTNHFPAGQAFRKRVLKFRLPKKELKTPVVFPKDGRNPAVHRSYLQRYKELDPEWGLPTTVIQADSATPSSSATDQLLDYRPTEMLMPALHGIKGDEFYDQTIDATLKKDGTDQEGPFRFDHRPLNYRWKVALLPFFVNKDTGDATALAKFYSFNTLTQQYTITGAASQDMVAYVESNVSWKE